MQIRGRKDHMHEAWLAYCQNEIQWLPWMVFLLRKVLERKSKLLGKRTIKERNQEWNGNIDSFKRKDKVRGIEEDKK